MAYEAMFATFIELPQAACQSPSNVQLMAAEGGGLGFAEFRNFNLYMWSRDESVTSSGWTQQRVIELKSLVPALAALSLFSVGMIALAGGVGVVFIGALGLGVFAIGLKSG
jgi:hypothetical protein